MLATGYSVKNPGLQSVWGLPFHFQQVPEARPQGS